MSKDVVVKKDKQDRRLKKVKIGLMREPKFALWSGVLMVGKTIIDDNVPTACTDGRNELYGRDFIAKLSDKELAFVIMHENFHKLYRHLFIWRKLYAEDPQLANAACDYVINLQLVNFDPQENHMAVPRKDGKVWGCLDKKYAGMNAKQVFDDLKAQQNKGGKGKGKGGGGGGGVGPPEGFDEHDWDGAQELSEKQKEELVRDIDQALRQGQIAHSKLCGKGDGNFEHDLADLLKPKVDWREQLREFVTSTCSARDASSWRRVNRRYLSEDVYLPSLIGERVGELVLTGDTSGSMGGGQEGTPLHAAISEIRGLMDCVTPEKVDLLYWDSSVEKHEVYESGNMSNFESETQPRGGGGTSPRCVQEYMKENNLKPECIIMITDGYIYDWGDDWKAPLLWVVIGNEGTTAPVGKTIHIEEYGE